MGVVPISIEYVAPPACPDEISVRAGVIARLGTDPFQGDAPRVAMIDVQPTGAGFVAAIELREPGRPASRRAVGPALRCEDAVDALELALAVIIDPTYSAQPPAPPPPHPLPQPAPVAAVYEPPGWRVPTPASPSIRRHELALAIGVVAGTHPEAEGTFGLRAGYMVDEHWRIGMVGRLANGNGTLTMDAAGNYRHYETRTSELEVEGCRRYRFLLACALVGVGTKSVHIDRYDYALGVSQEVADYSDPFAIAGANLSLEVPLGRAYLRPLVEGSAPLPNVPIESEGLRHLELPVVRFAFDLSLGYRW
ncbi:MAG TPA: hypothetical protein VMZ53_34225 [Kofleriaceae bacterium]|nr:hypothetical protein [Kofleriaceae bacterium]